MKLRHLLAGFAFVSAAASAHTVWVMPSQYTLSSDNTWIEVTVTAGNMTFVVDKPVSADNLKLFGPDGKQQTIASHYQGKRQSLAEALLKTDGTYRLELSGAPRYMTFYKEGGERKRLFLDKQQAKAKLPKDATEVQTMQVVGKALAFVTVNGPTDAPLKATGHGLEVTLSKHPADIVEKEPVTFTFTLDGKPVPKLEVTLSHGGELYRNDPGRQHLVTDAKGQLTLTPSVAGRYLLETGLQGKADGIKADRRRDNLTLTFEVGLQ